MEELRNKYLAWDKNSQKSNLIYLAYGILSIVLTVLIYPKISNLDYISLASLESLFVDMGIAGTFLRVLRVIVYLAVVYFVFDMIMNKESRFNVMKASMLVSAFAYAGVIYILSPLIKLLSFNERNLFDGSLAGLGSIATGIRRIKIDFLLALLIFSLVFSVLSIYIYFKNKSSQSVSTFEIERFNIEHGEVEELGIKNINLKSASLKKIVGPIIIVLVLFIGFKVWDSNFNLITVDTEEMYNVHFSGTDGEGYAEVYKTKTADEIFEFDYDQAEGKDLDLVLKQIDAISGLEYKLDKTSNLKNGDKVILSIQNNKKELKNLGLKLSVDTIEYTVNSLSLIPNSAEDIKNIDDIINKAKDNINFTSFLPDRNGKASLDGVYFTNKQIYEKETGSIAGASNQNASIGLIFKITGENKTYFSDEYNKIEHLYFYRIDDLLIDDEGIVNLDSLDFTYLRYEDRFDAEKMDRKMEEFMKTEYGMVKVK